MVVATNYFHPEYARGDYDKKGLMAAEETKKGREVVTMTACKDLSGNLLLLRKHWQLILCNDIRQTSSLCSDGALQQKEVGTSHLYPGF